MPSPPKVISTDRLFVFAFAYIFPCLKPTFTLAASLTLIYANADIPPRRRLSLRSSRSAEAGTGHSSHSVTSTTRPVLVNDALSGVMGSPLVLAPPSVPDRDRRSSGNHRDIANDNGNANTLRDEFLPRTASACKPTFLIISILTS
ncbi:hypothetical protein GALMADRAFT_149235 [Galerina marginata CBS 339.88]|uniref:Uncharacterized protein n=1 Tax=Galerina marginata (strain CBS 339.88) TaxID=685588 RepID=A0A067S207_GALM3|nr:hypothetical protein GALMADRAFT_149235 [Galerina marginata CBS 339.88]